MQTLKILRKATYQLVQDFFHNQYEWQQLGPHNWSYVHCSLMYLSNQFEPHTNVKSLLGFSSIVILVEAGGMDILLRTLNIWNRFQNMYTYVYMYIPGTQMALVLIGKGLVLEGSTTKIEVIGAPCLHCIYLMCSHAHDLSRFQQYTMSRHGT